MESKTLNVYFGSALTLEEGQVPLPSIVLKPTSDNWNDFGLRTIFSYRIYDIGRPFLDGKLHLGFLTDGSGDRLELKDFETEDSVDAIANYLQSSGKKFVPAGELPRFYTLHPDMQAYREIVAALGPENATVALLSLNDLVAQNLSKDVPSWFHEALKKREFIYSFVRNSETLFALHNAGSILTGLDNEELKGISRTWNVRFRLPAFSNPHEFTFSFEHDGLIPKRIAALIGKNGVGKSQALANIVRSLTSGDESILTSEKQRPILNRLIAISSPGETRRTFPSPSSRDRVQYKRIFLNGEGGNRGGTKLGDVIVQLARSRERIKENDRWSLFCGAISTIAPIEDLVVRADPELQLIDGTPFVQLERLRFGNEQERLARFARITRSSGLFRRLKSQTVPLSSGQLTFARFAAQACLHIENGTLVLIDEPETHLHPNFISNFLRLLDRLLQETGSFSILATHSPHVIRELPSSQVVVLRETQNREVECSTPRLKTLGADIGAISTFVFGDTAYGDETFDTLFKEIARKIEHSGPGDEILWEELEGNVSAEVMMYLRRTTKEQDS
jgi:ABC-type Mn2+/Zn2+ transport system ATPase subunit